MDTAGMDFIGLSHARQRWRWSEAVRSKVAAVLVVFAVAGCAAPTPRASLFDRLGGMPGVTGIADETLDRTVADPRTRRSFDGIKLKVIKDSLAQQLCSLTGGPCRYEGETMRNSHQASRITDAEFDLMVGFLRDVLDRRVGNAEKNELLRLLAPMKRDIVTG